MNDFQELILQYSYIGIFLWFVFFDQITPIPEELVLITMGFIANKAAMQTNAGGHDKRSVAVGIIACLVCASGHPYAVAFLGDFQGVLEVFIGVGPCRAVIGAHGILFDVYALLGIDGACGKQ